MPTATAADSRADRKLIRSKTSDEVAERLLEMIFAGELQSGDRIDLDAVAEQLGVSRAPVREALLALERDGVIEMPYHRGAFVARFDAARQFRRVVNVAAGGPHLRGLLRTFGGLLPVASRLSMDRSVEEERRLIAAEFEAISTGEAERAGEITLEHLRLLGEHAIETLRRRGVLGPDQSGSEPIDRVLGVRLAPEEKAR